MNRYFSDETLQNLLNELEVIPSLYKVWYSGETKAIHFDKFKYILEVAANKTFSKCSKDISKVEGDLGAMVGKTLKITKHSAWLWFNFDGVFDGYPDEIKKRKSEAYEDKLRKDKQLRETSIIDGTYGLNRSDKDGVYLMSCGDYYKIGFSKDVQKRLSAIRGSNPVSVELVVKYSPYHKNIKLLEKQLHERFADSRHNLEWFRKEFTKDDFIAACVEFCKR